MTDINQLLEKAASDARKSVRPKEIPQSSDIERRARRRTALLAATSVLVIGVVTAGILLIVQPGGEVASSEDDTLITSEMILEDGVVTEEEYRAGAEALVVCYTNAGIEVEMLFESNGHASFFFPHRGPPVPGVNDVCRDSHLSDDVSLGWAVALGQLDLTELREQDTAVTACVEERSGEDFGDLDYDQFDYLTEQGQQARDAAFEYQDHQPWGRCRNDLGYEEDQKAESMAILECVETRTGEDFGELEFDDTGHPTEASQQALNLAYHYQDDQPWESCRTELGYPNRTITSDK